jgi:stage II sporulation protein AA (anti-sigma F factor antagonist)
MTTDMTDATVKVAIHEGLVEIVLEGEIDLANAKPVAREIQAAITNQTTAASIDLSRVSYMDSAGLHILFDLAARLPTLQIALELISPVGSQVRRVMELCGLTSVAVVKPDA